MCVNNRIRTLFKYGLTTFALLAYLSPFHAQGVLADCKRLATEQDVSELLTQQISTDMLTNTDAFRDATPSQVFLLIREKLHEHSIQLYGFVSVEDVAFASNPLKVHEDPSTGFIMTNNVLSIGEALYLLNGYCGRNMTVSFKADALSVVIGQDHVVVPAGFSFANIVLNGDAIPLERSELYLRDRSIDQVLCNAFITAGDKPFSNQTVYEILLLCENELKTSRIFFTDDIKRCLMNGEEEEAEVALKKHYAYESTIETLLKNSNVDNSNILEKFFQKQKVSIQNMLDHLSRLSNMSIYYAGKNQVQVSFDPSYKPVKNSFYAHHQIAPRDAEGRCGSESSNR